MHVVSACVHVCDVHIYTCVRVHSETRGQSKKLVFRECPSFIRDRIFVDLKHPQVGQGG